MISGPTNEPQVDTEIEQRESAVATGVAVLIERAQQR